MIFLNPSSFDPYYKQITDQLRSAILTERITADTVLPSVRELASQIGVSVITVKRAYSDLEKEGLLFTRPGIGTFVSSVAKEEVMELHTEEVLERFLKTIAYAKNNGIDENAIRTVFEKALSIGQTNP
jgi:GntR family transcriptional regulator